MEQAFQERAGFQAHLPLGYQGHAAFTEAAMPMHTAVQVSPDGGLPRSTLSKRRELYQQQKWQKLQEVLQANGHDGSGWTVEVKVRQEGESRGSFDAYFWSPNNETRYRSLREVEAVVSGYEVPHKRLKKSAGTGISRAAALQQARARAQGRKLPWSLRHTPNCQVLSLGRLSPRCSLVGSRLIPVSYMAATDLASRGVMLHVVLEVPEQLDLNLPTGPSWAGAELSSTAQAAATCPGQSGHAAYKGRHRLSFAVYWVPDMRTAAGLRPETCDNEALLLAEGRSAKEVYRQLAVWQHQLREQPAASMAGNQLRPSCPTMSVAPPAADASQPARAGAAVPPQTRGSVQQPSHGARIPADGSAGDECTGTVAAAARQWQPEAAGPPGDPVQGAVAGPSPDVAAVLQQLHNLAPVIPLERFGLEDLDVMAVTEGLPGIVYFNRYVFFAEQGWATVQQRHAQHMEQQRQIATSFWAVLRDGTLDVVTNRSTQHEQAPQATTFIAPLHQQHPLITDGQAAEVGPSDCAAHSIQHAAITGGQQRASSAATSNQGLPNAELLLGDHTKPLLQRGAHMLGQWGPMPSKPAALAGGTLRQGGLGGVGQQLPEVPGPVAHPQQPQQRTSDNDYVLRAMAIASPAELDSMVLMDGEAGRAIMQKLRSTGQCHPKQPLLRRPAPYMRDEHQQGAVGPHVQAWTCAPGSHPNMALHPLPKKAPQGQRNTSPDVQAVAPQPKPACQGLLTKQPARSVWTELKYVSSPVHSSTPPAEPMLVPADQVQPSLDLTHSQPIQGAALHPPSVCNLPPLPGSVQTGPLPSTTCLSQERHSTSPVHGAVSVSAPGAASTDLAHTAKPASPSATSPEQLTISTSTPAATLPRWYAAATAAAQPSVPPSSPCAVPALIQASVQSSPRSVSPVTVGHFFPQAVPPPTAHPVVASTPQTMSPQQLPVQQPNDPAHMPDPCQSLMRPPLPVPPSPAAPLSVHSCAAPTALSQPPVQRFPSAPIPAAIPVGEQPPVQLSTQPPVLLDTCPAVQTPIQPCGPAAPAPAAQVDVQHIASATAPSTAHPHTHCPSCPPQPLVPQCDLPPAVHANIPSASHAIKCCPGPRPQGLVQAIMRSVHPRRKGANNQGAQEQGSQPEQQRLQAAEQGSQVPEQPAQAVRQVAEAAAQHAQTAIHGAGDVAVHCHDEAHATASEAVHLTSPESARDKVVNLVVTDIRAEPEQLAGAMAPLHPPQEVNAGQQEKQSGLINKHKQWQPLNGQFEAAAAELCVACSAGTAQQQGLEPKVITPWQCSEEARELRPPWQARGEGCGRELAPAHRAGQEAHVLPSDIQRQLVNTEACTSAALRIPNSLPAGPHEHGHHHGAPLYSRQQACNNAPAACVANMAPVTPNPSPGISYPRHALHCSGTAEGGAVVQANRQEPCNALQPAGNTLG